MTFYPGITWTEPAQTRLTWFVKILACALKATKTTLWLHVHDKWVSPATCSWDPNVATLSSLSWPVCGVIMFSKPAWISGPPGSCNRSLTVSLLLYLFIFIYIIQGTVSGSIQATDRLMKELRDVYRSESFKRGALSCTSWQGVQKLNLQYM